MAKHVESIRDRCLFQYHPCRRDRQLDTLRENIQGQPSVHIQGISVYTKIDETGKGYMSLEEEA